MVIVQWEDQSLAVSYIISRSDTADNFVEIAADVIGTTFLDDTGATDKFYLIKGVDKRGNDLRQFEPLIVYDATNVCKIFGTIQDVNGRPEGDAKVIFRLRRETIPETVNDTVVDLGVTRDEFEVFSNDAGRWEAYLLRNVTMEIYIPDQRFSFEFMVPDQVELEFSDIGNFGAPSPINNPF